ncbi:CDP-glycerol glycerophosphotransferase family protein [Bacillus subtilis]
MTKRKPKISVIVPVYNVEKYLRECLDSLANQTLKSIEVIMVNDGSEDNSGLIMDEYSSKYDNFYSYHKENGGLGHARNYGVQYARGEFIAFVDSDDYLSLDAYKKMYQLASENQTDIVVGNVKRFNSTKVYGSGLHKKVFSDTIPKTHITINNELIYDTTAWNKIFRREFWMKNDFKFPEGMLYEDLPVTIPAHYKAESVSVLGDFIYFWRAREAGDKSITQQRNDLVNLTDRLKALDLVDSFFNNAKIKGELKDLKDYKALSLDIPLYLNILDTADSEYIKVFMTKVSSYLKTISDETFRKLNAIDRAKYYFISKNDIEGVFDVLKFQKNELKYSKPKKIKGQFFWEYPFRKKLPEEICKADSEFTIKRKIERVKWDGSVIRIEGYHFIRYLDIKRKKDVNLKAYIFDPNSGEKKLVNCYSVKRPDITLKFGREKNNNMPLSRVNNYDWSGYTIEVDTNDLFDKLSGKLEIWIEINCFGKTRSYRVGEPISGKKPRPKHRVYSSKRIFIKYNSAWDLYLDLRPVTTQVNSLIHEDGNLIIQGETSLPLNECKLLFRDYNKNEQYRYDMEFNGSSNGFKSIIPKSTINRLKHNTELIGYVRYDNDNEPLTYLDSIKVKNIALDTKEITIDASPAGNLRILKGNHNSYLENLAFTNENLLIEASITDKYIKTLKNMTGINIVLKNIETGHTVSGSILEEYKEKGEFFLKTSFGLSNDKVRTPFNEEYGVWRAYLEFTVKGNNSFKKLKRIKVRDKEINFPKKTVGNIKYFPYVTKENNISINNIYEWNWIERGPRRQEVIEKILYPLFRLLPMKKKTIVFESYWGKQISCNPKAIYDYINEHYPEYECVWMVNNDHAKVDGEATKVKIKSLKYFQYMARAKYFVNNVNFPDFYEKRKNAVELQTMHGTPLKTLGLDVPGEVDTEDKRNRFLRRCRRWDYLTVPSKYVSDLARRIYDYKNEILETGYPRNDKLFKDNNEVFRQQLKQKLSLPTNKKVILYAPTFRVKNGFELKLDLEKLRKKLKDDYVILLRLHYFISDDLDISNFKGFAYNVSNYDDIQDLYLLSDVLITDYSSVMFDYGILKKPMIFFTYDLEEYRDNLRGMYLNIEEEAPGPLVRDNMSLSDSIEKLDSYFAQYGEKYKSFRAKYCEFDDGNASEKVVKRFLNVD